MKFSIIVPVYNVAPYLRECLDSVLSQTYTDLEAICVDDGSADGSGAILDEYAKKDKRFKVIHQKNQGVSVARNAGLENATGEWILFLDGDDVIANNTLSLLLRVIKQSGIVDLIRFSLKRFSGKEICKFEDANELTTDILDVSRSMRGMPLSGFTCFAYRAKIVQELRFEKYVVGEDLLFLSHASLAAKKVAFLNAVLYGYRSRRGSVILSKETMVRVRGTIYTRKLLLEAYSKSNKNIPYKFWKRHLNVLVENVSVRIRKLSSADCAVIKNEWISVLREVVKIPRIPLFHKCRIVLILACPLLVKILGEIPYQLKVKCR